MGSSRSGHCGAILLMLVSIGLGHQCLGQTVNGASAIKDFVVRRGTHLQAGGENFYITGFNNYYLPTYSAWVDGGRTDDVDVVFRDAQKLGLNALRTWAFSDGADQWNAIQPHLGQLNDTILSQGLDYVVAKAAAYGIRVILTLTNYWPDYGGPPTWAHWYNCSSIVDFYQAPSIRAGIKAYMRSIVMRNNTITGRLYRDEPAILAWDIMNEPLFPGDDTGKLLTDWVDDMSTYLKSIDTNHLVMVASFGYFGASSSASLVAENPTQMVVVEDQDTRLFPVAQICQGEDSSAIASLENIDLSDMHIYPELWSFCDNRNCNFNLEGSGSYQLMANLSSEGFLELCSSDCRLAFLRRWIRSHLEECKRIGKPLIVTEFGARKPITFRNSVYKILYDELSQAKDLGLPVAGSLFWMLEAPAHNGSAHDSYAIFTNSSMYTHDPEPLQPMPPSHPAKGPDPVGLTSASNAMKTFYNQQALLRCASARIPVPFNAEVDSNTDGWETTLNIISQQAHQLTGSA